MEKITFGIITHEPYSPRVKRVVNSIEREVPWRFRNIEIVGGEPGNVSSAIVHYFDNSLYASYVTRKRNIVGQKAITDIIVCMHDYITLQPGWWKAFWDFGTNWDVCMHRVEDMNGDRYNDWQVGGYGCRGIPSVHQMLAGLDYEEPTRRYMVPYDYDRTQYMHISGRYWVIKKGLLLAAEWNEFAKLGEGDDVGWSAKVCLILRANYKMNPNCVVRFIKPKEPPLIALEWKNDKTGSL